MTTRLALNAANGTFQRSTTAFLLDRAAQTLQSYAIDAPRTVSAAVAARCVHGPITPTDGAGRRLLPRCTDDRYAYAVAYGAAASPTRDGIYRTADAVNWDKVNTNNPGGGEYFRAYEIFHLEKHGLLIASERASDGAIPYWYYSADRGVTWAACKRDGGANFAMHGAQQWAPWTVAQNAAGTCLIGSYQSGDFYRLYRSTNGIDWTTIDLRQSAGGPLANTRPDTSNSRHVHHMCYHAATGKWLCVVGDVGNTAILVSTDDGLSWNFLRGAAEGAVSYQPTWLFDIGHATALLCGTDEGRGLYLVHLADGSVEQLWQAGDKLPNKCSKFIGARVGDLYIVGTCCEQRINAASPPLILASPDGLNWATVARLDIKYIGPFWIAGAVAGTLLLTADEEPGGYGTGSVIETAYQLPLPRVKLAEGLVLEDGVTNLAHSTGTSWTKSTSGWNSDGGAVQYLTGRTDAIEGGDYLKFPAGAPAAYFLPYRTFALGSSGSDRWFHINAVSRQWGWKVHHTLVLGKAGGGYNYPAYDNTHLVCDRGFAEYIGPPTRLDAGQTAGIISLQTNLTNIQGAALPTEGWLDLDLLQVALGPNVTWHTPNVARGHERVRWSLPAASEWLQAFMFCPREPSRYLVVETTRKLYLLTWKIDAENFLSLYYNCADGTFKLAYMVAGENGTLLTTGTVEWWECYAGLRFVLRAEKSATKLSVQNADGVIHTAVGTPVVSMLNTALTLQNGDHGNRAADVATNQLPGLLLDNVWLGRGLTDSDVEAACARPGFRVAAGGGNGTIGVAL